MILSTIDNGKYSVASELGILCVQVSREQAKQSILDSFEDTTPEYAENILNTFDPEAFRQTWQFAIASSLLEVTKLRQELAERERQDSDIAEAVDYLKREKKLKEIQQLQDEWSKQRTMLTQFLAKEHGGKPEEYVAVVEIHLFPLKRKIEECQASMN